MDGLSAAASGLAVVSLAIQLAEGCKKLYNFWESVKDAPEEVSIIAHDLRLLSSVIENIDRASTNTHGVTVVLNSCLLKMQPLHAIVDNFERSFKSKSRREKFWGPVKAASASKQLRQFRESLNETKATLMLGMICQNNSLLLDQRKSPGVIVPVDAMPPPYSACEDQQPIAPPKPVQPPKTLDATAVKSNKRIAGYFQQAFEAAFQDFVSTIPFEKMFADQMTEFEAQRHGAYIPHEYDAHNASSFDLELCRQFRGPSGNLSRASRIAHKTSSVGVLFGRIWQRTSTLRLASKPGSVNGEFEITTSFIFFPSSWLTMTGLGRGLEASLKNSRAGWTFDLNPIRAVPDNSLIFEFCTAGDWLGVERLLRRGDASLKDTNSRGWTPLHFATEAGHVDLAKRLLNEGADKRALAFEGPTKDALSPITIFVATNYDLPAEHKINMLRLFSDCLELTDPSGDGWTVHAELKRAYNREKVPIPENSISWLLRATASEQFIAFGPKTIWTALQSSVRSFLIHEQNEQMFRSLLGLSDEQRDEVSPSHATSIAHWLALRSSQRELLPMILEAGRLCHIEGFDWIQDELTPSEFVRTLPVIYHSWALAFPNNVEHVKNYMCLELEHILEKAKIKKGAFLAALSRNKTSQLNGTPTDYKQNDIPQIICSSCQDDYSDLGMGVISPAWIAFQECTKTNHRHQCSCSCYLKNTCNPSLLPQQSLQSSPPPSSSSEYVYPFPEEDEDDSIDEKESPPPHAQADLPAFNSEFIASQTKHLPHGGKGDAFDPFTEAATVLYRAQGRTWLSKTPYGADEKFCATCFLLREQYIGPNGLGTEGEFPEMPESYSMCRVGEGEYCFDA